MKKYFGFLLHAIMIITILVSTFMIIGFVMNKVESFQESAKNKVLDSMINLDKQDEKGTPYKTLKINVYRSSSVDKTKIEYLLEIKNDSIVETITNSKKTYNKTLPLVFTSETINALQQQKNVILELDKKEFTQNIYYINEDSTYDLFATIKINFEKKEIIKLTLNSETNGIQEFNIRTKEKMFYYEGT